MLLHRQGAFAGGNSRVDLRKLAGCDYISLTGSGPIGALLAAELERQQVEVNEIASVRTFYVAAALVAQGAGVSVVDEFTARARSPPDWNIAGSRHGFLSACTASGWKSSRRLACVSDSSPNCANICPHLPAAAREARFDRDRRCGEACCCSVAMASAASLQPLERVNMPAPVIGGLIAAVGMLIARLSSCRRSSSIRRPSSR